MQIYQYKKKKALGFIPNTMIVITQATSGRLLRMVAQERRGKGRMSYIVTAPDGRPASGNHSVSGSVLSEFNVKSLRSSQQERNKHMQQCKRKETLSTNETNMYRDGARLE